MATKQPKFLHLSTIPVRHATYNNPPSNEQREDIHAFRSWFLEKMADHERHNHYSRDKDIQLLFESLAQSWEKMTVREKNIYRIRIGLQPLTDKVDAKAMQPTESLTSDMDLKQHKNLKKARKRIEGSSDESEEECKTSEKSHKVKRREDSGDSAKRTSKESTKTKADSSAGSTTSTSETTTPADLLKSVGHDSNSLQTINKGNASSSKNTTSKSSDHTSSHTLKQSMKADQESEKPHEKDKIRKKSSLQVTGDKHDKPEDKQSSSKEQPTLKSTKSSSNLGEATAKKVKDKSAKSSFSDDGRTGSPSHMQLKDDTGKQSLKDSQSTSPLPEKKKKKKKKPLIPDGTLNKGVLCQKTSCKNTAVFHCEWDGEFCSFQCAITHVNQVYKAWMRKRRETITS